MEWERRSDGCEKLREGYLQRETADFLSDTCYERCVTEQRDASPPLPKSTRWDTVSSMAARILESQC